LYLRDLGPTEVGGFGITEPENLLCVSEFQLITQHCTETFVAFDDAAVADYFDDQTDLGRQPQQCGRIWIHTHPGDSPLPSSVDIETFHRVFGHCDWAVMFILARSGDTFARLHWRHGQGSIGLEVEIDYGQPFPASDELGWQAEYEATVQVETWPKETRKSDPFADVDRDSPFHAFGDPLDPWGYEYVPLSDQYPESLFAGL